MDACERQPSTHVVSQLELSERHLQAREWQVPVWVIEPKHDGKRVHAESRAAVVRRNWLCRQGS